ncbi:hypothetical protein AB0B10_25355 [Micromonospora arborensis]|uniref:hypothetical protein n=1 Tax=Micromonospora arborensis TaxID=2116518 RepID=UPI0033E86423
MTRDADGIVCLLRRLPGEPTRPARFDLAEAVRVDRRRRRARLALTTAPTGLAVLAAAALPLHYYGHRRSRAR